jgi:flagellar hook-length control protein FliK
MEVTGIGKLAGTSPAAGTKANTAGLVDFSSVLGRIWDSGDDSGSPQKAQTSNSGTKRDAPCGEETKEKTDTEDSQDAPQTGAAPAADAQSMAGAEQTAAAQTPAPAQSAAPAGSPAGQTAQTVPAAQTAQQTLPLPAEAITEPTPILTPETFAANIKAALEKSADTLQTPQTDTPQLQTEQIVQTVQTAQPGLTTVSDQPAPQETQPAVKTAEAAALKPGAETGTAETHADSAAVQQPAAATQQNSDTSARSGGNGTVQTEETVQLPRAETKKADASGTAAAQFSTAVNSAQTAQPQDAADMQAAVNRALDQFDQDFQGVTADTKNLQISLHPKELGTVSISLAAGSGGVTAKIQTSSAEAASMLSAQVQRMIESMEAKGVRVQNVEVVLTQTPQQNTGDGSQSGTQQYQPQNTRLYAQQSTSVEKESALSDYERMTETYSAPTDETRRVEYRV